MSNKNESSSLVRYFSDIGTVNLLSQKEEIELFRKIEQAERDLLKNILKATEFARKQLPILLQSMEKEERQWQEGVTDVARGSRSQSAMHYFMRSVRFTESGRDWMEQMLLEAAKFKGPKDWAKLNRKLERRIMTLKHQFAKANLRLVVTIAKKFWRSNMSQGLDDLIQEGNIGLMKSVDRFDVDRGYKFSTYSMWWIRHFVKRAISEKNDLVRLPVHMTDGMHKLSREEARYYTMTGNKIEEEELVRLSGHTAAKVRTALMSRSRTMISLDAHIGDSDVTYLDALPDSDTPSPLEKVEHDRLTNDIREMLTALTPFESRIVRWRFGLDGEVPLTLQEIAEKFNLSRERIRQIESRALRKLKLKPQTREYQAFFQQTG